MGSADDPRPHRRASSQMTSTEYAAYIRQITGDGEAIVDCLIRIMEDDSVGAKALRAPRRTAPPRQHRLRKNRRRSGRHHPAGRRRCPRRRPCQPLPDRPGPRTTRRPGVPSSLLSEETLFHLPPIVRQKTGRGRKMADFLNAVVRGEMKDFKPHHWIRAAKAPRRAGLLQGGRPRASRTLRSGRHEAHRQALPRLQALPPGRHEADHPPRLPRYGRR